MRMRGGVCVLFSLVLCGSVTRADGLHYAGVCDEQALRRELALLVDSDPFVRELPELTVTVEPIANRLRGTVSHGDAARSIERASCESLVPELAFIVATLLAQRAPTISSQEPVTLPAPTVGPTTVIATKLAASRAPAVRRYELLAGGAITDDRQLVGSLGARVRGSRLSLAVELAVTRLSISEPATSIHVSRDLAVVTPCVHAGPFAGCAMVQAGWLRGRGEGFAVSSTTTSPHVAVGARAVAEQALGRHFAIGLRFDLTAALSRHRLLVDDMPVWSSSRAEASLGLFAIARIP